MTDENHLTAISRKLDVLIRLSAIEVIRGVKLQKDQIAILSDSGFKPKEIADILRTSSNNVSVALVQIRKERAKTEKKNEKLNDKQESESTQGNSSSERKDTDSQ